MWKSIPSKQNQKTSCGKFYSWIQELGLPILSVGEHAIRSFLTHRGSVTSTYYDGFINEFICSITVCQTVSSLKVCLRVHPREQAVKAQLWVNLHHITHSIPSPQVPGALGHLLKGSEELISEALFCLVRRAIRLLPFYMSHTRRDPQWP